MIIDISLIRLLIIHKKKKIKILYIKLSEVSFINLLYYLIIFSILNWFINRHIKEKKLRSLKKAY